MGFLSKVFRTGEDPADPYSDEVLGSMIWSEDDEAWLGELSGTKFSLAYDGAARPSEVLIAYAKEILVDRQWLESTLNEAKVRARQEFEEFFWEEINALNFGRIHFYLHHSKRRILADLNGGKDDRAWRIEYQDRDCEGIGFDR